MRVVLEAVDGYLLILNSQRQILAANHDLLHALGREDPCAVVGLRPGEAVNCLHFSEGPEGCGTSKQCAACGAVLTIMASQGEQRRTTGECRLSTLTNGRLTAQDFRVTCTPIEVSGERLTAFVLHDISGAKRREVLEQTFLHDFANSLGGLESWSRTLSQNDGGTAAREILSLAETLKEAVDSHKTLVLAESGELQATIVQCSAQSILQRLRSVFAGHPARAGKTLEIVPAPEDAQLSTDPALLLRVVTNMVKNALEATSPGGVVRACFEWRKGRPAFLVQNPGHIPEAVRPHVFERSFSTKEQRGRGIGAYCMKLYGERYLGGSVAFESSPAIGTRFWIELPAPGHIDHAAPVVPAATPGACRVLLVEDDEPLSRLFELFLESLGLEVTLRRNGAEALKTFGESPLDFDLLITDGKMPGMSGLELGRKIAAIRQDIPMVYCTGSAPGSELRAALVDAGFRGFVAKPFSMPSLATALNAVVPGCATSPL